MLLFKDVHGKPVAVPPLDKDLKPLKADGKVLLSLAQAVKHFGMPQKHLVELAAAAWGKFLPDTDPIDAAAAGVETITGAAGVKLDEATRLELLRDNDDRFAGMVDDHWNFYLAKCAEHGFSPYCHHLYPRLEAGKDGRPQLVLLLGIDGARLLCESAVAGNPKMEWSYEAGVWLEGPDPIRQIIGARYTLLRRDGTTMAGVAEWKDSADYVEINGRRELGSFWAAKPGLMLMKCAEAAAYRRAFPALMSGFYTTDEYNLDQKLRGRQASRSTMTAPAAAPQNYEDFSDLDDDMPESREDYEGRLSGFGFESPDAVLRLETELKQQRAFKELFRSSPSRFAAAVVKEAKKRWQATNAA